MVFVWSGFRAVISLKVYLNRGRTPYDVSIKIFIHLHLASNLEKSLEVSLQNKTFKRFDVRFYQSSNNSVYYLHH